MHKLLLQMEYREWRVNQETNVGHQTILKNEECEEHRHANHEAHTRARREDCN